MTINPEILTPKIAEVKKAVHTLNVLQQTRLTAEKVIADKRNSIGELKRELNDTSAHIGEEGFRDLNKISSELKRTTLKLESIISDEINYTDKMLTLVAEVKETLDTITETLTKPEAEITELHSATA